jgi:hypothetical protein
MNDYFIGSLHMEKLKNEDPLKTTEAMRYYGMAVEETLSGNGIFYPKEEIAKGAASLQGVKMLKDHDYDHVDSIIGKVERVEMKDGKLMYEATIFDEGIKQKVDAGLIDNVSIGYEADDLLCSICGKNYETCGHTRGTEFEGKTAHVIAKGITFKELSLVVFPGVGSANIGPKLGEKHLCEKLEQIEIKKAMQKKEVDLMETEIKKEEKPPEDLKKKDEVPKKDEEPKKEAEDEVAALKAKIAELEAKIKELTGSTEKLKEENVKLQTEGKATVVTAETMPDEALPRLIVKNGLIYRDGLTKEDYKRKGVR